MRPPVPTRAEFAVFFPITTRFNDNDQYGHVNNAVYYEYFDTAVNSWVSQECGNVGTLEAIGLVAESSCRYVQSAMWPARLEVGFALLRLGSSSVSYQLAVFPEGGNQPHVVGRFVHVYVDPDTRRPTAVPSTVAAAVATLPVSAASAAGVPATTAQTSAAPTTAASDTEAGAR